MIRPKFAKAIIRAMIRAALVDTIRMLPDNLPGKREKGNNHGQLQLRGLQPYVGEQHADVGEVRHAEQR